MTHHSAYSAGRQAYFAGRSLATNPWTYTDTPAAAEMHEKWRAGWLAAQEEEARWSELESQAEREAHQAMSDSIGDED